MFLVELVLKILNLFGKNSIIICLPPAKRLQLALLRYLLYCSGLGLNQGVLVNRLFTVDTDLGHLAEVGFIRFPSVPFL